MVALTVVVILGVVWLLDLHGRLGGRPRRVQGRVSAKKPAAGPALALANLGERLEEMQVSTERLEERTAQLEDELVGAVRGVALRRFRAFEDTGGDQSFALALVDGEGNGAVISALHGRGRTRVYAKSIRGWLSAKALSDEEKEALAEAKRRALNLD